MPVPLSLSLRGTTRLPLGKLSEVSKQNSAARAAPRPLEPLEPLERDGRGSLRVMAHSGRSRAGPGLVPTASDSRHNHPFGARTPRPRSMAAPRTPRVERPEKRKRRTAPRIGRCLATGNACKARGRPPAPQTCVAGRPTPRFAGGLRGLCWVLPLLCTFLTVLNANMTTEILGAAAAIPPAAHRPRPAGGYTAGGWCTDGRPGRFLAGWRRSARVCSHPALPPALVAVGEHLCAVYVPFCGAYFFGSDVISAKRSRLCAFATQYGGFTYVRDTLITFCKPISPSPLGDSRVSVC